MFGSTSFGGFGQQNQQGLNSGAQPAGGSLFGQPATTPAFGQPAATPAFGQSTATTTPTFGQPAATATPAFGQPAGTQPTSFSFGQSTAPSAFGAPKPATGGFGAFGAPTTTPATTAPSFGFGATSTPAQPSTFGQAPAFGQSNTSFFGQPAASATPAPAFGGAFGGAMAARPTVTQGTATAPYAPFRDDITPNETKPHAKSYEVHQSITAMPAYVSMSPEELRLQDYNQGRSKGTAGPTPLSTAPAPAAPSFGFGSSSFGTQQPQQPASTGLFGQPSQPSGSLFGQPQQTPALGTSAFGAQNNAGAGAGGGGLFGAASKPSAFGSSTSMFGQPAQNTSAGGGGGLFGGSTQAPSTGFSFGSNASKPPAFGGFGSSTQPPSTGFSFGSNTQPAQQPSTGFSFGNTQPSTGSSGGAFGSSAPSNTGFSFGANNASKPGGLFGSAPSTAPSTTPSFGGFGASSATNTTAPAANASKPAFSFGGFGASQSSQPSTGFGSGATNTGGGLFGAKPAGTGLFGSSAPSTQPSQPSTGFGSGATNTGGGLFGAKPAGTGLFGSLAPSTQPSQSTQPSLFGQSNTQPPASQPPATGGGLFGSAASKPSFSFGASQPAPTTGGGLFGSASTTAAPGAASGGGLFGSASTTAPNAGGGGLFGAKPLGASAPAPATAAFGASTTAAPAAPPSLTSNPYGTDTLLGSVPAAAAPAASQPPIPFSVAPKSKPPLVSPFRSSPRNAVRVTRLRGSTPGLDSPARERTPAERATPVRAGSVGLFHGPSDAALSPQAFIPRSTSKRLVLDGDTSLSRSSSVWREGTPRARFSPAVEKLAASSGAGADETETSLVLPPVPRAPSAPARPLQRGDYYTEPSLSALRAMQHDELAAVRGLVVGRVGFGRVAFLEAVDLTTVPDLAYVAGGIVQLRAKECFVYPQAEDLDTDEPLDGVLPGYVPVAKAPLGAGLNVPARVSLEGCWPLDRATREPLTDAEHPRVKQHLTKLRHKRETEFVSYDVASGTWTFVVQHFSRYGLDDDESDEADDPPAVPLGESDSSSAMHESELESDEPAEAPDALDAAYLRPPAVPSRSTPAPAHKVEVMRASFFGQAPPTRPVGGETHGLSEVADVPQDAPAADSTELAVARAAAAAADVAAPAAAVPLVRVPLSTLATGTPLVRDAALSLARSFRVGLGPCGVVAHNGTLHGRPCPSLTQVALDRVRVAPAPERLLEIQLACSELSERGGLPCVAFRAGTCCASVAQHYAPDDRDYAAQLWHLAAALFDPLDLALPADAPAALVDTATALRRKAALSAWLERAAAGAVQSEARAHIAASRTPELVFTLLSGHQVEAAADAAADAGDVRLATLVAQAGGAQAVRDDVRVQLDTWRAEGVDAHVDRALRRVYEVLAGNVVHADGTGAAAQRGALAIAGGLDWRRALGLHVWYGCAWEAPLRASVERYEAALRAPGDTAPPLPPYQADAQLGVLKQRALVQRAGAPRDAMFELLKLHVDAGYPLAHALDARNFARGVDYALPWHLYQFLARALRVRDFADDEADARLSLAYAAQLEAAGTWRWAAFVLLHVPQDHVRRAALEALLARHVDALDELAEAWLDRLCVPRAWRALARATAAHARGDYYAEYTHRVAAEDMSGAHRVAVHHLASSAFLRDASADLLLALFEPLAAYIDAGGTIAQWNEGGRVFCDFVALPRLLPGLLGKARAGALSPADHHRLQDATTRTHELMERVPLLFPGGADDGDLLGAVARTEMLAVLHSLARVIASETQMPLPAVHWTPAHPPDAEALQAAATDFAAAMLEGVV